MTAKFPLNLDHPMFAGYPLDEFRKAITAVGDDQDLLNAIASILESTEVDELRSDWGGYIIDLTTCESILKYIGITAERQAEHDREAALGQ